MTHSPSPDIASVRRQVALTTFLVRDYDEAIAFFTEVLGFALTSDADMGAGKRWVSVAARAGGPGLLLAKAVGPEQEAAVGRQGGGRVFLFLHTDDFAGDHARMTAAGVRFLEPPRNEPYGTVAVFEDLYGNRWDLLQPKDGVAA
jgi:predicted enzyme related to lactoylglutathione lyase